MGLPNLNVPPPHPRAVSAAFAGGATSTLTVSTRSFTQPVPSSVRDSTEMEIDPALLAEDAAFAGGLQLHGTGISARFVERQRAKRRGSGREFVQGSSRVPTGLEFLVDE